MGIVGTVDSAYKALDAAAETGKVLAMVAAERFALDCGSPLGYGTVWPSAGVRRLA